MHTLDNSVTERIRTDEDVFAANNLTREEFEKKCEGLGEHEVAFRFLGLLCKALNGDWTPDFDDDEEWKYEPWFVGGSSGFRYYDCDYQGSDSSVGSRLCFDTREKAIHAGKTFTNWYKKIIVINQPNSSNGNA